MSSKSPGQLTSAKEICDIYSTPFDPMSRALQLMTQKGILQAEQGAKGGYQIIKDLTKISMQELYNMIIGPIEIANCFHDNYCDCELAETCHIISPMLKLNENINNLFSDIMVADLLGSKHSAEKTIRGNR